MLRTLAMIALLGSTTALAAQDTREQKDGPRSATEAGNSRKTEADKDGGSNSGSLVTSGKLTQESLTLTMSGPCP